MWPNRVWNPELMTCQRKPGETNCHVVNFKYTFDSKICTRIYIKMVPNDKIKKNYLENEFNLKIFSLI